MTPKNMDRREFLRRSLIAPAAAASLTTGLFPLRSVAASAAEAEQDDTSSAAKQTTRFTLPPLPYPPAALEPHIDRLTMAIHHGAHHAAYVNNLNKVVAKYPQMLAGKSAEELIRNMPALPEAADRDALRNNGGGHVNHTMFWEIMKPGGSGGGEPTGAIADAIRREFGSFAFFQNLFNETGTKRFGSGWVWLAQRPSGRLVVLSTPNQDNPLMNGLYPIFGNDVWEHAYYLKYQNRRADYLKAWWNVLDWEAVNRRFAIAPRPAA